MSDLSRKLNALNLNLNDDKAERNSTPNSEESNLRGLHSYQMNDNDLDSKSDTIRGSNLISNLNLRNSNSGGLLYDNINASVNTLTNSNGTTTPLVSEISDEVSTPVEGQYFSNRGSSHSSLPIASAPRDIPSLRKNDSSESSKEANVDNSNKLEDNNRNDDHNNNDDDTNDMNISINSDVENHQGQVSPELLATSVGMDEDGRLVPSTSNISLLSLNYSQMTANLASIPLNSNQQNNLFNGNTGNPTNHPNYISTSVNQNSATQVIYSGPWVNKAQMNSINQQRYNYYSGPGGQNLSQSNLNAQISNTPQPGLYRKYSLNQQQQNSALVSPQPPATSVFSQSSTISPKPILTRVDSTTLHAPDSPPLNPTSVGGSPSGFWLGNGSPPNSIPNGSYLSSSYLTLQSQSQDNNVINNGNNIIMGSNSRTNSFGGLPNWRVQNQLHQLQNKIPKSQPSNPQLQTQVQAQSQAARTSPQQSQHHLRGQPIPEPAMHLQKNTSDETPYASIGNRSPEFAPVGGTLPPMTPLNLSSGSMMNALGRSGSQNGKSPASSKSNRDDSHRLSSSGRSGYHLDGDEEEDDDNNSQVLEDDDNTDVFAEQRDADDL